MIGKYDTGCGAGKRPWDMCKDSTGVYWGKGWGNASNVYNNVYNSSSGLRKALKAAGSCLAMPRYNPSTSEGKGCSYYGAAEAQQKTSWSPKK